MNIFYRYYKSCAKSLYIADVFNINIIWTLAIYYRIIRNSLDI